MNPLKIKISFLVIFGTSLFSITKAQICTVAKLPELLKLADIDSVQKIERLAALKFHVLINSYRKSNGLDTIAWDEALWVSCRNHNAWMGNCNEVSHAEKKGTKNFTGNLPDERYSFATEKKGKCSWSGENALSNSSGFGNSIYTISENIATHSFKQWKDSPGHNKNMLGKTHKVHGVAFHINENGTLYGTDLFASNFDDQFNNLTQTAINNTFAINTSPIKYHSEVIPEKRVKLNLQQLELDLTKNLYNTSRNEQNCITKKHSAMERASSNHSKYMCGAKLLTHHELKTKRNFSGTTEEKRMMKATRGLYLFSKHKTKLTESVAVIDADAKNIDLEKLANDIQIKLDNDSRVDGNIINVGYGVKVFRTKNDLKVYVTRLVGFKAV